MRAEAVACGRAQRRDRAADSARRRPKTSSPNVRFSAVSRSAAAVSGPFAVAEHRDPAAVFADPVDGGLGRADPPVDADHAGIAVLRGDLVGAEVGPGQNAFRIALAPRDVAGGDVVESSTADRTSRISPATSGTGATPTATWARRPVSMSMPSFPTTRRLATGWPSLGGSMTNCPIPTSRSFPGSPPPTSTGMGDRLAASTPKCRHAAAGGQARHRQCQGRPLHGIRRLADRTVVLTDKDRLNSSGRRYLTYFKYAPTVSARCFNASIIVWNAPSMHRPGALPPWHTPTDFHSPGILRIRT